MEPGGQQSVGSHRFGHDRSDLACPRSIHVAANGIISLLIENIHTHTHIYIHMYVCVYIYTHAHSSVNGHLSYFHILAI